MATKSRSGKTANPSRKTTTNPDNQLDTILKLLTGIATSVEVTGLGKQAHDKKLAQIARELRGIRDEASKELGGLRVEMARLDEKLGSVAKDLEFSERLAKLEEKYDLLLSEGFEQGFALEPIDVEEFEDYTGEDDEDEDEREDH